MQFVVARHQSLRITRCDIKYSPALSVSISSSHPPAQNVVSISMLKIYQKRFKSIIRAALTYKPKGENDVDFPLTIKTKVPLMLF